MTLLREFSGKEKRGSQEIDEKEEFELGGR